MSLHPSFFVTREKVGRPVKVFLNDVILIQRFKITRRIVSIHTKSGSARSMFQKWSSYYDQSTHYIDYDSISQAIKDKYSLPSTKDVVALLKSEFDRFEKLGADLEYKSLLEAARNAYDSRWPIFLQYYSHGNVCPSSQKEYAKAHALLDNLLTSQKEKWASALLYKVFQEIRNEQLSADQDFILVINSYRYFQNKLRLCKSKGIPTTLVHAARGVRREYKVKMTGHMKAEIRLLLRNRKRFTFNKIVKKIEKKYGVTLSVSSIQRIKSDSEVRNVCYHDARGIHDARNNGLPKLIRQQANGAGEIYEADYYKTQFYCRSMSSEVIRLWLFAIIDVFSKKIVGWSLDETRSASMAIKAFQMAFTNEELLPEEIMIDNDALFKRFIFKRFVQRTNNIGIIWNFAKPNRPTYKSNIESFFAVFQKMHSDKNWYIGEAVYSKNCTGNPSRELVRELFTKKKDMLSSKEMTVTLDQYIKEYNACPVDRQSKETHDDLFRLHKSTLAVPFCEKLLALIFWKRIENKKVHDDGAIYLQRNGVKYTYQVTEPELFWKVKNTTVAYVMYSMKDLSKLYLFDHSLQFMGKVEGRMILTRESKSFVLNAQRKILQAIENYALERRVEDLAAVGLPPSINEERRETLLSIETQKATITFEK